MSSLTIRIRVLSFAAVLAIFGLIVLYALEFSVFSNTIGIMTLVLVAALAGALAGAGILYAFRRRLTPWERHLPEVFTTLVFSVLFAPLFASLINRVGGEPAFQSFEFVSELPYLSSNYGILKGEKIRPSGYILRVKEGNKMYRFQYKSQAYYPLTKPGEKILLPVRKGLLGFRVVELK